MQRTREEFDADRSEGINAATKIRTDTNRFELNCSICNGVFFVNEETLENANRAMKRGDDNEFVCSDCRQEYEDISVGNR